MPLRAAMICQAFIHLLRFDYRLISFCHLFRKDKVKILCFHVLVSIILCEGNLKIFGPWTEQDM